MGPFILYRHVQHRHAVLYKNSTEKFLNSVACMKPNEQDFKSGWHLTWIKSGKRFLQVGQLKYPSVTWMATWSLSRSKRSKDSGQKMQEYVFWSMWNFMWLSRAPLLMKPLLQMSQVKGQFPSRPWNRKCWSSLSFSRNAFPHCRHLNGRKDFRINRCWRAAFWKKQSPSMFSITDRTHRQIFQDKIQKISELKLQKTLLS